MLTLEPFSEDQGRSAVHPARGIPPISFLAPCGFTHPLTRTHVRLLGPCFKTGRMGLPTGRVPGARRYIAEDGACCQPRSTRRHLHEPIDSSGFGRRTNPHRSTPRVDRRTGYRRSTSDRDASPAPIRFPPDNFKHSLTLFSKSFSSFPSRWGLGPGPPLRTLLQTTIRTARPSDFQAGLIPVRSPLLRESLYMFTGRSALQGSTMILPQVHLRKPLLRLLLPLNDKVQWNSRDVAGGEPPTFAAILTLHRTIQSVGATGGCVQRAGT
ncbi:hypothetical protein L1887_57481 [Cichorium endivia]|nr:hypothetical protein L1887_57481 [Cichorium endivia]